MDRVPPPLDQPQSLLRHARPTQEEGAAHRALQLALVPCGSLPSDINQGRTFLPHCDSEFSKAM